MWTSITSIFTWRQTTAAGSKCTRFSARYPLIIPYKVTVFLACGTPAWLPRQALMGVAVRYSSARPPSHGQLYCLQAQTQASHYRTCSRRPAQQHTQYRSVIGPIQFIRTISQRANSQLRWFTQFHAYDRQIHCTTKKYHLTRLTEVHGASSAPWR